MKCPICKSEDITETRYNSDDKGLFYEYYVTCNNCGRHTRKENFENSLNCSNNESKTSLIKIWHDKDETPTKNELILIECKLDDEPFRYMLIYAYSIDEWFSYLRRWCYIKDLKELF